MSGDVSYFEAMGGFRRSDEDAAVKFALNGLLLDRRLSELKDMLSPDTSISGVGGEPGWTISWASPRKTRRTPDAWVLAEVEEEAVSLAYPEARVRRDDFLDLVDRALEAYERRGAGQPEDALSLRRIVADLRSAHSPAA